MGRSKNYLNRKAKLPRLEKLTQAYMATGKWHDSKVTRLDERSLVGFALTMLLPDTTASRKAKGALLHIFDAEDALEEVNEKRTKLSTVFTPVTTVSSIEDVLIAFANLKGFFAVWFDFDLYGSTTGAPSLIKYTDELADKLTSKEAKEWLSDKRNTPAESQLAYYALSTLQTCLTLHVVESINVIDQTYVTQGEWDRLNATQIRQAHRTFHKALDNIDEVFATTLSTPSCPLWENSTEKAEKDKVDHLLLKSKLGLTTGPTGRSTTNTGNIVSTNTMPPCTTTTGNRGTTRKAADATSPASDTRQKRQKLANLGADDLDGYLVWTGDGNSLPNSAPKTFPSARLFGEKAPNAALGITAGAPMHPSPNSQRGTNACCMTSSPPMGTWPSTPASSGITSLVSFVAQRPPAHLSEVNQPAWGMPSYAGKINGT
jgi:hypothetical protein